MESTGLYMNVDGLTQAKKDDINDFFLRKH